MVITKTGKKGQDWEDHLERGFEKIVCTIVRTDAPVQVLKFEGGKGRFVGYFKKPGQLDFEGGYTGSHVAFDAKTTKLERFYFKKISDHQLDRMEKCWNLGEISGLLLRFQGDDIESDRLFGVGYELIADRISVENKKSVTLAELEAQIKGDAPGVHELEYGFDGDLFVRGLYQFMLKLLNRPGRVG